METVEGTESGPLVVPVVSVAVDGSLRDVLSMELVAEEVNPVTPTVAKRGVVGTETVVGAKGDPVSDFGLVSGQVVSPGAVE